jgi:hypothetical protein
MKFRVIQFVMILALVPATLLRADDISGKWEGKVQGRGGQLRETIFNFKVDGEKLTGTVSGGQRDLTILEGKMKGDEISFAVMMNLEGKETKVYYTAKVSGDEIKGKRVREGFPDDPQEFTAKRAK